MASIEITREDLRDVMEKEIDFGATLSTVSTEAGSKIPPRHDFGVGLFPCALCEAPRCLNRGCKETQRVICEECWEVYATELVSSESDLSSMGCLSVQSVSSDVEDEDQVVIGTLLENDDESMAFPANTPYQWKPSVGSWHVQNHREALERMAKHSQNISEHLDSSSVKVSLHDNVCEGNAVSDETNVPIEDLHFESSLLSSPLGIVREGTKEDEQTSVGDGLLPCAVKRLTVTFQPGSLGLDFQDDRVTFVRKGGQADQAGVASGWKVRKVNGVKCVFFGDKRMRAARKGNASYDVTFEVPTSDAITVSSCHRIAEAPTDAMGARTTTSFLQASPCSPAESTPCSPAESDDVITDLEAKFAEQCEEAVAALCALEQKANTTTSHITNLQTRHNGQLPTWLQCDLENDQRQAEEHVVDISIDKTQLLVELKELQMDVTHAAEGKNRLTVALALATKREQEARTQIEILEARVKSREKELLKNMRSAEHLIKQLQKQNVDHEHMTIEIEESLNKSQAAPGTSFLACGTGPYCGSDSDRRKSWWYRYWNIASI